MADYISDGVLRLWDTGESQSFAHTFSLRDEVASDNMMDILLKGVQNMNRRFVRVLIYDPSRQGAPRVCPGVHG